MKKRKTPALTPSQVECLGVVSPESIPSFDSAAVDILRLIDKAEQRKAARPQRSEDVAAGRCPPLTNRGEKEESPDLVKLVLEDGKIKEVPKRRGFGGDSAMIDWVNFTIGEETIQNEGDVAFTDHEVMIKMSNRLHSILGFGITSKRANGANFYRDSYDIGDGWGMVCHGGQRGTILVMLSGSGCAAAKEGWELRLKQFLESADRARLSRLDLAYDDYTGTEYSVDQADADHSNDLFRIHGRTPDCEYRGNWKNPNGKGRTFTVGNRKNGKFARIYEKGKQLGSIESNWVRIEVEFKSVDRVIPFNALLVPGEYLSASYPAFNWINERQERIFCTKKETEASFERAIKWIKHQCGSSINVLKEILGSEEFFKQVIREEFPKWAKVPHFAFSPESIQSKSTNPVNLYAAASAW